ncbi:MAG: HAD-IA family hydrolase [Candidatus Sulfotelmatobacter sp.]
MTTFRCSAILFDLDGVLIDSTRSVDRQWRAWAREQGIDEEKVIAIAHGVRSLEVIRAVAPHLNAEAEVRRLETREADDQVDVAVMPGAIELVDTIPDGRWGVVTSGTRDLASARLRLGGLRVPKILVTAEDVTNGKPHPEPYLRGAELLGIKPEECLVIEDAPAGIRAARGGGMKVIALASTYPASKLGEADAVALKLNRIQVAADGGRKLEVSVG